MRRITLTGTRVIAALSVLSTGAACSAAEKPDTDADEQSPVIAVRDWNSYPTAEIVGHLGQTKGCLLVGDSVAFWADGTSWDALDRSVVFGSGDKVKVGDQLSGGGGHYSEGNLDRLDGLGVMSREVVPPGIGEPA